MKGICTHGDAFLFRRAGKQIVRFHGEEIIVKDLKEGIALLRELPIDRDADCTEEIAAIRNGPE